MNRRYKEYAYYYDNEKKENLYILSIAKKDVVFINDTGKVVILLQGLFDKYLAEGRLELKVLEGVNKKALKQFKDICYYGKLKLHIVDPQAVRTLAVMKNFKELIEYIDAGKYLIVVHNYFKNGYWLWKKEELKPIGIWDRSKNKKKQAQDQVQDQVQEQEQEQEQVIDKGRDWEWEQAQVIKFKGGNDVNRT